ncbi:MAG: Tol-Pal system beta propeller repeat protein TolB [Chromatiales bacterium]|nr:Tol-Pal system beta propeller repeat protein TolB [Chromatiales bacterium]
MLDSLHSPKSPIRSGIVPAVGLFGLVCLFVVSATARAELTIEITGGAQGALPIAIVPFELRGGGNLPEDVAAIVSADLHRSGRFKVSPRDQLAETPQGGAEVDFSAWRAAGAENLVVGWVETMAQGQYAVQFRLFDVFKGEQLAGYSIPATARGMRRAAHQISDIVYKRLTGQDGAFTSRIAYITKHKVNGETRFALTVADADGWNPKDVVKSREPLMSPAWSPDGSQLAYVSFEGKKPAIYIQEVITGQRRRVPTFSGINGAPAWSPDGRQLALTLSKDGSPDIYVYDLASGDFRRVTDHYAIDTEPVWTADGQNLLFTSDRGGQPQIYQVSASGGRASRVTFEGSYNARARVSPDGRQIALVHQERGKFYIALQDLDNGRMILLSEGGLDESPSFAPNGSMVLYATASRGQGVLAAVSVDGRVHQRLAIQKGDVREPAWSPSL